MSNNKGQSKLSGADWLLAGLFSLILAIILLSVFFRYVINHSLFWSDEVVRYCFVWFILLGAALTLRDRRHLRVEYFVEHFPAKLKRTAEYISLLLIAAFSIFLSVAGIMWVKETQGTYTSALGLPLNLVFYAALPAASIMSVWFAVKRFRSGQFSELDAGAGDEIPE
jgi:TRAP-type C4-dicarboxylate transport system permease small subunit